MGRIVKTFLHIFFCSIVPHSSYYSKIIKTQFRFSAIYFLFLLLLISFLSVLFLGITILRYVRADYKNCLSQTYALIPPDYAINIKNGVLATNNEMPLLLWFNCNNSIKLLAVIDERATQKSAGLYGAHILVTGTDVIFRYKTFAHTIPISQYIKNMYISKEDIVEFIQKLFTLLYRSIPIFVLTLLFVAPIFFFFFHVVLALGTSLTVFAFFKLFGKKYHYKKILQIGFHSYTFPLITSFLFILFPVHLFNILLLSFSLFFIFQLTAVYETYYHESSILKHHSNK